MWRHKCRTEFWEIRDRQCERHGKRFQTVLLKRSLRDTLHELNFFLCLFVVWAERWKCLHLLRIRDVDVLDVLNIASAEPSLSGTAEGEGPVGLRPHHFFPPPPPPPLFALKRKIINDFIPFFDFQDEKKYFQFSALPLYTSLRRPCPCTLEMVCIFSILFSPTSFLKVLTRGICLTIKGFFSWWSFPLFSWP